MRRWAMRRNDMGSGWRFRLGAEELRAYPVTQVEFCDVVEHDEQDVGRERGLWSLQCVALPMDLNWWLGVNVGVLGPAKDVGEGCGLVGGG